MKDKLIELGYLSAQTMLCTFALSFTKKSKLWTINFCNKGEMIRDADIEICVDKAITFIKENRELYNGGITYVLS